MIIYSYIILFLLCVSLGVTISKGANWTTYLSWLLIIPPVLRAAGLV